MNAPILLRTADHGSFVGGLAASAAPLLDAGVRDGVFTAYAYGIVLGGELAVSGAGGTLFGDSCEPATGATLFDLASLTKPFTALAALRLRDEGLLDLDDQLRRHVAEAGPHRAGRLSLRSLATHTSGLPPWRPLYEVDGHALEAVLTTEPEADEGARYAYSDIGYMLLGMAVEAAADCSLADAIRSLITEPLGMPDLAFAPKPERAARAAATRNCPWRGPATPLRGVVHDANAASLGGVAGHAGLFGTVTDLAILAAALRGGSRLGLRPETLAQATTRQIATEVGGQSIGWFMRPNRMLPGGDFASHRAIGHTGFTGTSMVTDPDYDVTAILLTNRVWSTGDGTAIARIRRLFINTVLGSIRSA